MGEGKTKGLYDKVKVKQRDGKDKREVKSSKVFWEKVAIIKKEPGGNR